MNNLIDMVGKKFGRLTVVRRNYPNGKKGQVKWLCKCTCGKKKIIEGYPLRSGLTKSCGCLQREIASKCNRIDFGFANMHRRIDGYKRSAKKKGHSFELTDEQIKELLQMDCHYCGAGPNNIAKAPESYGAYTYNGIDRIDNSKGYTINNVVPCCRNCNTAKNNHTLQEFKDWLERAYNKNFINKEEMSNNAV